jgi:hypothetical protein
LDGSRLLPSCMVLFRACASISVCLIARFSASVLLLMAGIVGYAQAPLVCNASLFDRPRIVDPTAWLRDNVSTYVEGSRSNRAIVVIVGDVVVLDQATFPSLVVPRDAYHTGVERLVVDAREIVLDMEIALQGGHIVLHADVIRFGPRARLTLSGDPGDRDDGLELVANHLDLRAASPRGLLGFQTQRWSGGAGSGVSRSLHVSASTVSVPQGDTLLTSEALANDPRRFFFNMSNDRGAAVGQPWEPGYANVRVGREGRENWERAVATEMRWPLHAAEALLDLYAADPFNPVVRLYIEANITALMPLFLTRADPRATLALRHLQQLIRWDRDLFGLGRFAVPMVSLQRAIDRFSLSLDEVFGPVDVSLGSRGLLAWWDEQIVGTLTVGAERATRDAMIAEIERLLQSVGDDRAALEAAMSASEGRQEQLEQEIQVAEDAVEARRMALVAGEERRRRSLEQNQAWFRAANLVVSTAASALGTPAAGAVVSTVLSAVEADSMGRQFDVVDAIGTYAEMRALNEQRSQQFAELHGRWSGVREGTKRGVDLLASGRWSEAREVLGASHEGMLDIVDAVRAHANDLRVRPITALDANELAALDADDGIQQDNLVRLGAAHGQLQRERVSWIAMLEEAERLDRKLVEKAAALGELRTLDLTNDAAQLKLRELAAGVRAELLLDLARDVAWLRRSYQYVTGRPLSLPQAILGYADRFAFRPSVLQLDAVEGLGVDASPDGVRERMRSEREQAAATYRTLLVQLRRQFEAARSDAVLANVVTRTFGTLASTGWAANANERAFLAAINEDLYRQSIDAGHPPTPILLPYGFDLRGIGPVGLLGIAVSGIDLVGETELAGEVEIVVAHPRFGRVQHADRCVFVVDAFGGGQANGDGWDVAPRLWTATFGPGRLRTDTLSSLQRDFAATTILDFALPLDTSYSVTARLLNRERFVEVDPPVLAGLEIVFFGRGLR